MKVSIPGSIRKVNTEKYCLNYTAKHIITKQTTNKQTKRAAINNNTHQNTKSRVSGQNKHICLRVCVYTYINIYIYIYIYIDM